MGFGLWGHRMFAQILPSCVGFPPPAAEPIMNINVDAAHGQAEGGGTVEPESSASAGPAS